MPNYIQGRFKPSHPEKYRGDITQIIYRSSWEMSFMCRLDKDPNVVTWSSEELIIPYVSPVDGEIHRYFPDFQYRTKDKSVFLVEIKPYAQTQEPKKPKSKRVTRSYASAIQTYMVNKAKWKAVQNVCENQGWKFKLLTERDLGFGNLNTRKTKR